jgi:hypothetical protein
VEIRTFQLRGELTDRRPICGRELARVDDILVCLPPESRGSRFWVLDGELTPTGSFPTEHVAMADALHAADQRGKGGNRRAR